MVRAIDASSAPDVLHAFSAAVGKGSPFVVLVHSPGCGHCVRMMPAYDAMLRRLGKSAGNDALRVDAGALHSSGGTPDGLLGRIRRHAVGVPFLAIVMPPARANEDARIVPLPDHSDRSADSLTSFAKKHLVVSKSRAAGHHLRAPSPARRRPSPSQSPQPLKKKKLPLAPKRKKAGAARTPKTVRA